MTFKEYIRLSDELYEQAFKRDEIFREAENKRAKNILSSFKSFVL